MKKITLFFYFFVLFCAIGYAETIILKSGKIVKGKIVEKTETFLEVDVQGVPVLCFFDEIEEIQSDAGKKIKKDSPNVKAARESFNKLKAANRAKDIVAIRSLMTRKASASGLVEQVKFFKDIRILNAFDQKDAVILAVEFVPERGIPISRSFPCIEEEGVWKWALPEEAGVLLPQSTKDKNV